MRYTIEAVLPPPPTAGGTQAATAATEGTDRGGSTSSSGALAASIERVTSVEAQLLRRREELCAFEREYRQVGFCASRRVCLLPKKITSDTSVRVVNFGV